MITNKLNLPQAFVKMAETDYIQEPNEYRVTQLLKGTREILLEKRHEVTQDALDMIWLLFGTAVHSILERQEQGDDELKETRIKTQFGKYTLSGQFDLYNETTKTITDYKTCSVWKVVHKDYDDWRRQTLIYAYKLRKQGFEVDKGQIVAIMKDHSKKDARFKPDYPNYPIHRITFDFSEKDFDDIEQFIKDKFAEIEKYEDKPDDELPICTPKERYNKTDKYAVMKKGRKSALRVFDTQEEAEAWKAQNGGDSIEYRQGDQNTKCKDYCAVNEFCSFYKEVVNGKGC